MFLKALCDYYDILDGKVDIPSYGYSNSKVNYVLYLSKEGELNNIGLFEDKIGKGNKRIPKLITVPFQKKRSSGVFPYFLCDNSKYVFGLSKDKKQPIETFEKHFEEFKKYNLEILQNVENEEAKAVKSFLNNWNIQKGEEILASINGYEESILNSTNFIFKLEDIKGYIHDNPEIRKAWIGYLEKNTEGEKGQCLVTGKESILALTHGNLKGVRDAQPAGAAIVSFNIPSFISYGKKQSYNAPVGIESEFKYVTVLNYMLQADSSQKIQIGDATTVFWAECENFSKHNDLAKMFFNPPVKSDENKSEEEKIQDKETEYKMKTILDAVRQGRKISEIDEDIEDDALFYILGLSPNNARIAVRYFYKNTFGQFIKNIAYHYEDLELEGGRFEFIPPWIIINETVPKQSRDKKPSPLLSGRLMRSILTGCEYPVDIYLAIIRRIRAEQDKKEIKGGKERTIYSVNHTRISILKAYLARKERLLKDENEIDKKLKKELKEVTDLSLNKDANSTSYQLGRLFYFLEKAQENAATSDLNATIKDKYFSTASASPSAVFPFLLRLYQHHLKKVRKIANLPSKVLVWPDKEVQEIIDKFGVDNDSSIIFPTSMNFDEQGMFFIGYYHQRQANFISKKEAKEEIIENQEG